MKRNKLYNKFIIIFFSLLWCTNLNAQTSLGKDFWISFLPNLYADIDSLSVIITGKNTCSGVVTNPQTGWSTSFNVTPGRVTNVYIPPSQAYDFNASDCVINKGLHITTTDSVLLYISCFEAFSFDLTNVLTTSSLGSDYMIQTYINQSQFTVVATEDNTTININLSGNSLNHVANSPFSVTLNAGQCYQVQSSTDVDLSGSTITVNDDKKIAVFAGNPCNRVPTGNEGRDHMMEQMIPTSYWGQEFVVTSTMLITNDRVRITALNNNCQIRKDGVLLATINARQTYEFEITTSNTPAVYLETSEPACVFLYFTGAWYGGETGDPSMVGINHIGQKINNATFRTFNAGGQDRHFVNVVTETANVNNMRLDGNNISFRFATVASNSDFSYAKIELNHGIHTLTSVNTGNGEGFVAHAYGSVNWESYSYSLGCIANNDTSTHLFVNNLNTEDYPDGFDFCYHRDSSFIFNIVVDYVPSDVVWYFGDGTIGNGFPISHQYNDFGSYVVICNIYRMENGVSYLNKTLSTLLVLKPTYDTTIIDTICQSEVYTEYGFNENQTGVYVHSMQTIEGCDSIVRLNLIVTPEYNDTIFAHMCEGQVYDDYGFYEIGPTITTKHLKTVFGCDSIITLDLKMQSPYTDTIYATIGEGGCYNKYGFYECDEGIYTMNYTTSMGCDSIVYLILEVDTEVDLYVENCITPKDPINNKFYIFHSEKLVIDEVNIYNRWGGLVFSSPNNVESWDGKYRGEYCPKAAYTYVINYHKEGVKAGKVKIGTVLLLY